MLISSNLAPNAFVFVVSRRRVFLYYTIAGTLNCILWLVLSIDPRNRASYNFLDWYVYYISCIVPVSSYNAICSREETASYLQCVV